MLAHPTPSPLSISTTAAYAPIPDLPRNLESLQPAIINTLAAPENTEHRAEALRLIADSVAQQRQTAAKALVLHPYSVTTIVFLTGFLARYCSLRVLFAIATTLVVAGLGALYWTTREYPKLAASINKEWLEDLQKTQVHNSNGICNGVKKQSKCDDPIVLVSRDGNDVVGALVLRVVKRERKAYVRAWTVDSEYRGRGVGTTLLQEGVKVAWGKGARCMLFDTEHANSYRALPVEFSGSLDEQEARAKSLLTDLVAEHKREKSSR